MARYLSLPSFKVTLPAALEETPAPGLSKIESGQMVTMEAVVHSERNSNLQQELGTLEEETQVIKLHAIKQREPPKPREQSSTTVSEDPIQSNIRPIRSPNMTEQALNIGPVEGSELSTHCQNAPELEVEIPVEMEDLSATSIFPNEKSTIEGGRAADGEEWIRCIWP
eukprot:c26219_g3_i1 orf=913-1416(+)